MKVKKGLIIWVILISMATAFSFAVDNRQMNLLLVGLMGLIPFCLAIQFPFIHKEEKIVYLLILAITISSIVNMDSFRISSLLYSMAYLITFIYYIRIISSLTLQIDEYLKILKFILYAYFSVLVVQQLCLVVGSPYVFNLIAGDVGSYKLNSLSPEPSHTARIVVVVMYSYITMLELQMNRAYDLLNDSKNDKFLWFAFLYLMLTMGSGFAIVLLFIFLLKFVSQRKILYLIPVAFVVMLLFMFSDLPAVERVSIFGEAFFKLNPKQMMEADHSASMRIVPIFLYINLFDISNISTWLGFGTDYTANLIPTLMPGIPPSEFRGGGIFPALFFDRGLICVILLFIMIFQFCLKKLFSFESFLLLLLIFAANFNTQLFWFSIMLFTTNKYLYLSHNKTSLTTEPLVENQFMNRCKRLILVVLKKLITVKK